jgi:hypothetical protein
MWCSYTYATDRSTQLSSIMPAQCFTAKVSPVGRWSTTGDLDRQGYRLLAKAYLCTCAWAKRLPGKYVARGDEVRVYVTSYGLHIDGCDVPAGLVRISVTSWTRGTGSDTQGAIRRLLKEVKGLK